VDEEIVTLIVTRESETFGIVEEADNCLFVLLPPGRRATVIESWCLTVVRTFGTNGAVIKSTLGTSRTLGSSRTVGESAIATSGTF
jgi:hypothetical protein